MNVVTHDFGNFAATARPLWCDPAALVRRRQYEPQAPAEHQVTELTAGALLHAEDCILRLLTVGCAVRDVVVLDFMTRGWVFAR